MIDLGTALHLLVDHLLWPVIACLFALMAAVLLDMGIALGEGFGGLRRAAARSPRRLEALARKRIGRADMAARVGPTLGLMGTLIPLGPGIAAMGRGDFATLAEAVATAFDTTVLGLLIGLAGYLIGRWRRVAYDAALNALEAAAHA